MPHEIYNNQANWSLCQENIFFCSQFFLTLLLSLSGPDLGVCKQLNRAGPLQGIGLKKIKPFRIGSYCFWC